MFRLRESVLFWLIKDIVQRSVIAYPVILQIPPKRVQRHRPLSSNGNLESKWQQVCSPPPLPYSQFRPWRRGSIFHDPLANLRGIQLSVVWYGYTMLNPWFHKWGLIGRPAWTLGAGLGAQLVVLSSHTTLFQCRYEAMCFGTGSNGSKYLKMCFVTLKSFHSTVAATKPWFWARPISHCYDLNHVIPRVNCWGCSENLPQFLTIAAVNRSPLWKNDVKLHGTAGCYWWCHQQLQLHQFL